MPSDTIELHASADDDTLSQLLPLLQVALSDATLARTMGQALDGRTLCLASSSLRSLAAGLNAALEAESAGFSACLDELSEEVTHAG